MRYSTGLVTLNLSMVVMMMAGVVRKKRRMKRTTLMTRQRSHQMKPRMERCSLGRQGRQSLLGADTQLVPGGIRNSLPSTLPTAITLYSPVDVLGVGGVGHGPVRDVQGLAAGRGAWLPTASAALALTHIEVLQDAGGRDTVYRSTRSWGPHC